MEGFTRADPEHMLIYRHKTACLRSFRGFVFFPGELQGEGGRKGVLIEIKPDRTGPVTLWRTESGRKGAFRIRGLKEGDYIMKVTLDGFQSIFQRIRVSRNCPREEKLRIKLELGV